MAKIGIDLTIDGAKTLIDTEYDSAITVAELYSEWVEYFEKGYTEAETFDEYLSNCLSRNGGTLEWA